MRTHALPLAVVITLMFVPAEGMTVASSPSEFSQQFGARIDIVTVDVSVFSGNRPVAGLGAADFVLTDRGVRHQLQLVSRETVPVELTLILEGHQFEDPRRLTIGIQRIAALLAPRDRLRIQTFANELVDVVPWRAPGDAIDLGPLPRAAHITPHDPLALSWIRGGPGERRH